MNSETIIGKCWHCGTDLQSIDYGRESDCRGCGKPTRTCRNCRWYAPDRTNQCLEPMAERVMEKTKANFCDYFEPTITPSGDTERSSEEDLRQAAEDLFKF
jgi:ribosomal protein L34E